MNWAWRLRGAVDRLLGGVGMRRGRRPPGALRPGDTVDFWIVGAALPNRLLRFRADMKLPGETWLEFSIQPGSAGQATLQQRAIFAPKGLLGVAYWYLLYPIHSLIFGGLLRRLIERAREISGDPILGHEPQDAIL